MNTNPNTVFHVIHQYLTLCWQSFTSDLERPHTAPPQLVFTVITRFYCLNILYMQNSFFFFEKQHHHEDRRRRERGEEKRYVHRSIHSCGGEKAEKREKTSQKVLRYNSQPCFHSGNIHFQFICSQMKPGTLTSQPRRAAPCSPTFCTAEREKPNSLQKQ